LGYGFAGGRSPPSTSHPRSDRSAGTATWQSTKMVNRRLTARAILPRFGNVFSTVAFGQFLAAGLFLTVGFAPTEKAAR